MQCSAAYVRQLVAQASSLDERRQAGWSADPRQTNHALDPSGMGLSVHAGVVSICLRPRSSVRTARAPGRRTPRMG